MRAFFYWFGIVAAGIVAVGLALFVLLAIKGSGADKSSKAYADATVVALTEDWDPTQLISRATPALMQTATGDRIRALFGNLAALGQLVTSDGCKGQAMLMLGTAGRVATAHYDCAEHYRHGDAMVELDLAGSGKFWLVNGFRVFKQ